MCSAFYFNVKDEFSAEQNKKKEKITTKIINSYCDARLSFYSLWYEINEWKSEKWKWSEALTVCSTEKKEKRNETHNVNINIKNKKKKKNEDEHNGKHLTSNGLKWCEFTLRSFFFLLNILLAVSNKYYKFSYTPW